MSDIDFLPAINNKMKKNEPVDDAPKYKACCLELFNIPFRKYKKWKHQDKNLKQIADQSYPDYEIFCNLKLGLEIIMDLIKYSIWRNRDAWDELIRENKITSQGELLEMKITLPQTTNNILFIFEKYRWSLDDLNPEIYNVVSLDNYELICKLANINQLFYFNTFPEVDDIGPVMDCENDVTEMWANIDMMIKKLMQHHIEIAKLPSDV